MVRQRTIIPTEDPEYRDLAQKLEGMNGVLKIDRNAPDDEVINQPQIYHDAADGYALTVSYRDAAKKQRDEVYAEANERIRRDANIAGEKVTVDEVRALCDRDDAVKAAYDKHLKWSALADRFIAMRSAVEQRGFALNHLIELWKGEYWGQVSGRVNRTEAGERVYDRNRETLRRARRGEA